MISQRCLFTLSVLGALLATPTVSAIAQDAPRPSVDTKAVSPTSAAVMIQIAGEVSHPLSLTAPELAKLARQTVRAKGHDGVESQYEGVALIEFLAKAGAPTGKDLRGPALAFYVVVEAADGYRAVFALAELDSVFADRVILLADRRDGKPIGTKDAPFQVIVPGEKKHARWVKQVTRLKVGRG
jgi:DMSO/TMAO reductase YedYZ molybdopterin-dependent catalytic subunit